MEESKEEKDSVEVAAMPETKSSEDVVVKTVEESRVHKDEGGDKSGEETQPGSVESTTKEKIEEKPIIDKDGGETDSTKPSISVAIDVNVGTAPDGQPQEKAISQDSPLSLPENQTHSDQKEIISTRSDNEVVESSENVPKSEPETKDESSTIVEISRNANNAAESTTTLDLEGTPGSAPPIPTAVDTSNSECFESKVSQAELKSPKIVVEDVSVTSNPDTVGTGESCGKADNVTETIAKESNAFDSVEKGETGSAQADNVTEIIAKESDASDSVVKGETDSGQADNVTETIAKESDASDSVVKGETDSAQADNVTETIAKESDASDSVEKGETDAAPQSKTEPSLCETDKMNTNGNGQKIFDSKTESASVKKNDSNTKDAVPVEDKLKDSDVRTTAAEKKAEEKVHVESTDAKTGITSGETKTEVVDSDTLNKVEEPQVIQIMEQVEETSDVQDVESKTDKSKDQHGSESQGKDANVNNNARDVETEECKGAQKESSMTKDSVRPETVNNKEESESKQKDSDTKTEGGDSKISEPKSQDSSKSEQKKDEKHSIAVTEDTKVVAKDRTDDIKRDTKDTRDRPSKSYSAQRTAIRGNRRGNVEESKDVVENTKASETKLKDERRNKVASETKVKDEKRNRVEDRRERDKDRDRDRNRDRDREKDRDRDRDRDKEKDRDRDRDRDRNRDAKGRDQLRDRGSQKESESEKSKNRDRDDRRESRDRKSTPPTQESRRPKTREEREQEEAERRKKDEERRKRREEERKQLEEQRKKREEEKKKAAEEKKQKEEEDKKREEERKAEEERRKQEEEQKRLEEEAARLKEEEEKQAREISVEAMERKEVKMEMRKNNLSASDDRPDESFFTKLDSSLKKNTTFVKKLRVMTESQRLSLTKEFSTLNLTKYVGEVATSIAEAKLKMADMGCAIHMCCLVHRRYAEFSSHLLQAIQKVLPALPSKKDKDKDEQKSAVVFDSKIRVELRFLAELIVAGVFTEKEGLPVLNGVLSVILNSDKESHSNLPIIISFTKHCGEDFAGCVPRKNRIIAEKFGLTLPLSEVFSPEVKKAYNNLLKGHYASVTKYLLKKHKDLQKLERQNLKMLQTKGELSDERQKTYEETQALYQKLIMNTSTLSDLNDEDMPDLPIDEKLQEENELMAMEFLRADGRAVEFDFETSLWEDEDTRTFHENLIDLRTMVPAILFKGSEKRTAPGDKSEEDLDKFDEDIQAMEVDEMTEEEDDPEDDEEGKTTADEDETVGETESGEPETEEPDDDDDNEEEEGPVTSHVSIKVLLDAFLQKLPECVNRDFIDKAAVDFCMNLNTKSNRKKLVKALFNVPRTRLDLLSFYSRLVATLYPCMPDIATDLVEKLKQDFRWHMRKKDQMKIESKIKIVRFLGELTKFKMCPKADTLHALKILLLVFHHHHIDMSCNLLDVCGRYLYRSKDSHLRTKALLDVMMRKRNKMHMNERHSTMVENAFFYCNPPESKRMEQKVRPPLHEYIRKLLFKDLTKITVEKVLKQMRKLPWDDMEIRQYAVKCVSSVWNIKFNNVHCMANLLAGLVLYHDYVGIQVVDTVLEDIRIGMEINYPKFNQRRVSVVKYLGELYNYRMVESSVIFKTMYSFIRFGVALDANMPSLLDPPEHLFRVRLTVTLLDTCGQFFDRGTSKKKLDCFLVYFQQYILFKRSLDFWNKETRPFPLDVDNAIADTFESLRPKLKMMTTLEEANDAVQELEKEYVEKLGDLINLTQINQQPQQPGGPLSTISESDETKTAVQSNGRRLSFVTGTTEDEEESDSDMDSEHVRRLGHDHSNPNSQSQGFSQNTEEAYDTEENMMLESAGENEEDDRVTVLTGGPRFVKCEEDDEFTSAFEKMMSDNLQQRTVDASKVPQIDIAVPVTARNKPKKSFDLFKQEAYDIPVTMNFTLMTRSGKKQQYHDFEVPIISDLAANLRNREMAEMAEKQRMKELTLNINERQEEEDYAEMIASLQKPAMVTPGVNPVVPRDRKPRFHHPKGAPDMEQIFHQTGNRKW